MASTDKLQHRWYEGRPPPWWTRPLAALYAGVVGVRRALYRSGMLRATQLPVPVIVVGNLSVGGTGKTPSVIALIAALRQRGFQPGVVSRGYGGSGTGARLLGAQPDPGADGDEPALIRIRTQAPVAVGRARPAAARLLLAAGVDVVIADDGLQHYALARDVEICVVDGVRRFGNARMLPAGPLREPLSRLRSVDFIVANGGPAHAGEVSMRLALADAELMREPKRWQSLASFAGHRVHAVAGIGNPARFFAALRAYGMDLIEHPFPDHHRFAESDLDFGDASPVLMTEKDAVKCRAFARAHWWSVPVSAQLPEAFYAAVAERVGLASR